MTKLFSDADVIHRYTRAQAIKDGVLVDVTEWATSHEMVRGSTIRVAMTAAVWALIQAPDGGPESTRERADDVLWTASGACRANRSNFWIEIGGEEIAMWVHVGPGDDGEPVATIMLEGED